MYKADTSLILKAFRRGKAKGVEKAMARRKTVWIYLLPLLHLSACITIALAKLDSGVHYLIYVDFPFSLLLVILGWRSDDFLIWFATFGTLWWFLLSWVFFSRFWKAD
jgi:hypothetical protein